MGNFNIKVLIVTVRYIYKRPCNFPVLSTKGLVIFQSIIHKGRLYSNVLLIRIAATAEGSDVEGEDSLA